MTPKEAAEQVRAEAVRLAKVHTLGLHIDRARKLVAVLEAIKLPDDPPSPRPDHREAMVMAREALKWAMEAAKSIENDETTCQSLAGSSARHRITRNDVLRTRAACIALDAALKGDAT